MKKLLLLAVVTLSMNSFAQTKVTLKSLHNEEFIKCDQSRCEAIIERLGFENHNVYNLKGPANYVIEIQKAQFTFQDLAHYTDQLDEEIYRDEVSLPQTEERLRNMGYGKKRRAKLMGWIRESIELKKSDLKILTSFKESVLSQKADQEVIEVASMSTIGASIGRLESFKVLGTVAYLQFWKGKDGAPAHFERLDTGL